MKSLFIAFLLQVNLQHASFNSGDHTDHKQSSYSPAVQTVEESTLDILTSDGIKLKATYYSPGKPGPAILLLHQCNSDRKSWQSLATSLMQSGIHVLSFDYRGYGESPAKGNLYEHIAADVDSAFAKLISQTGVDKNRIAAGGSSCGVNNSLQLAARNPMIKALFLLTGPISEKGAAFIKSHPDLPIFAAENGNEVAAVKELKAIMDHSKNPASTTKAYPNGEHGAGIFKKHPGMISEVTEWLVQQLN